MFKTLARRTLASALLLGTTPLSAAVIEPVNDEKLAVVEVRHANPSSYFMSQPPELLISTGTGSTLLKVNQKHRFLPAASSFLQLRQNNSLPSYNLQTSVQLTSGKTHIFDVPQLEFSWADQAFVVEVGPIPKMEVRQAHYAQPFARFPLNQEGLGSKNPYLALGVLPGTYEVSYAIVKPFKTMATGTTQWGLSQTFALQEADVPERSTMRFHSVEKKTYADAVIPACQGSPVYVWGSSGGLPAAEFKTVHNLALAANKSFHDVRFYASPHGTPISYFAQFGSIQVPISVAPGKRGEIEIKRLDVNQVKVVREDQTEYLAPSTFRVQQKRADGTMFDYELTYFECGSKLSTFNAPAGLYLPPGDYKITMNYKTAEGPKVKVIEVTL